MHKLFFRIKKILGKHTKVNGLYFMQEYRKRKEREESMMNDTMDRSS